MEKELGKILQLRDISLEFAVLTAHRYLRSGHALGHEAKGSLP